MTLAKTPRPPYVAVIFTSQQTVDVEGYDETSARIEELAAAQPGYLGIESARDTAGFGITVSYWTDAQSARDWRAVAEHQTAQERGRSQWYAAYRVRIATVERDYPEG